MTHAIRTVLFFNGRGAEAAAAYCSLIPDSRVERHITGAAFTVIDFTLNGVPYQILDAGPHFPLSECVSIMVQTPDQAETDRLWDALIADGGKPVGCGWLKDRFGLSWQIVPEQVMHLIADPDPDRAARAHGAVVSMVKLDLAAICAAAG